MSLEDLNGKVAVVTGGAGGSGRGIVEALLDEGARVVIADIEEPVLDATVAELRARGDVVGVRTDVSDFDSVDALAKTVFERSRISPSSAITISTPGIGLPTVPNLKASGRFTVAAVVTSDSP